MGTITGADGTYSLSNVPNNALLVFSFVGMRAQEISVADKTSVNVTLEEETVGIEEVVAVGYGVQKKMNLTGAISSVKMDEILGDRPVTSVSSALVGTIPGLQITSNNGKPGEDMSLNLRGITSINGGGPLVLVDNMPMDITMVNPNDIETVNVLKDAAASAIYGARAAFGVVLITTKQGTQGEKMRLDYSNNFAFSNAYNVPKQASPYYVVKSFKDAGLTTDPVIGADVDTWLDLLAQYEQDPSAFPDGRYLNEETGVTYYLKQFDRVGNMMDKFGFQQTHNVALTGSSDKTSYRISLGMLDEDGILYSDKDTYKRYNISSFISSDVTNWLKVQADIKYADGKQSIVEDGTKFGGIWGDALARNSYLPLDGGTKDGVYYLTTSPRSAIILGEPAIQKNRNLRALGRGVLTLMPGLTVTGEYSYNVEDLNTVTYNKIFETISVTGELSKSFDNSKYQIQKRSIVTRSVNAFANYTKDWGKHSFSAMGGFNQEDYDLESNTVSRLDMINQELPSIGQGTGEINATDNYTQYATRSLFYRLNYAYAGKYLVETNGRYDGSSKFPKDDRFGFFPSFSLGWRVSEESFMDWSERYLSNLKLRFSLGEIGNQAITPYLFVPGMDAYYSSWLVGKALVTSLKPPALVSTDFTWERVQTYNYGVDVGLFNNKLDLVFDYYIRNTMDMLAPGMELPSVLGAAAPEENVADLKTKGWELSINWRDKIGDVGYRIGLNLYDSYTKITKFDNEVGLIRDDNGNVINRVGKTMGEIWGFETDRLYQADDFDQDGSLKEGIARLEGTNPQAGDVLYVDQDDNDIINSGTNMVSNPGDLKIIGNTTRRYQYGIMAGVNYKGFDLSLFFQGVGKRDLWYNNDIVFPYFSGTTSTILSHQTDYWTQENTSAYYSRVYSEANFSKHNRQVQTRYLLDGSYIRLKNVTLSYTIPASLYQKINIDRINVFFSGEDLWTHFNTPKGIDPEVTPRNKQSKGWSYPNMEKISFGINLTL